MEKSFLSVVKRRDIHEAVLMIENDEGNFSRSYTHGGRTIDSPLVAASVTKLFTTTCILQMMAEGKISLSDRIEKYLDSTLVDGLHNFKGRDYSRQLTINHLLFQTSGLPDEFEEKSQSQTLQSYLAADHSLSFRQRVEQVKESPARFAPNGKKAFYANINFDLLGRIIETIQQEGIADVFEKRIFRPLDMQNTYLPSHPHHIVPQIYYKNQILNRPLLISSLGASGGAISTARDLMCFSKAFWQGRLFDRRLFNELAQYKRLQISKGPIAYGGGYMRIAAGGLLTMFMGRGELVGHSGSTGSFAFYHTHSKMHFVGDLNQFANPALPIRLLLKLAVAASKRQQ
ncbi:MAG TPA: serine hydrolase domain-containing protein [Edaphocola sp.]|nr:serine hydrolase domain-containing protein [Edaphocola sp.]